MRSGARETPTDRRNRNERKMQKMRGRGANVGEEGREILGAERTRPLKNGRNEKNE
jgi:hypothetical protein